MVPNSTRRDYRRAGGLGATEKKKTSTNIITCPAGDVVSNQSQVGSALQMPLEDIHTILSQIFLGRGGKNWDG